MTGNARPNDVARDFCQWPYERPCLPSNSAIRQENILFNFLERFDQDGSRKSFLKKIQSKVGRFNTVWGLKISQDNVYVELYFYDYERENRYISPSDFNEWFPWLFDVNLSHIKKVPFFMWSFELNLNSAFYVEDVDIYCDGHGGAISGGVCYQINNEGITLKNIYEFYESSKNKSEIYSALSGSPRLPHVSYFPVFAVPRGLDEQIYVVSHKRNNDALYLSRIEIDSVISLLSAIPYCDELHNFMIDNRLNLAHHLFDVGLDIEPADNRFTVRKVGLYGLL